MFEKTAHTSWDFKIDRFESVWHSMDWKKKKEKTFYQSHSCIMRLYPAAGISYQLWFVIFQICRISPWKQTWEKCHRLWFIYFIYILFLFFSSSMREEKASLLTFSTVCLIVCLVFVFLRITCDHDKSRCVTCKNFLMMFTAKWKVCI